MPRSRAVYVVPVVAAWMTVQRGGAAVSVQLVPALQRSCADPGIAGEDGERDLVFDMKPKDPPPLLAIQDGLHRRGA